MVSGSFVVILYTFVVFGVVVGAVWNLASVEALSPLFVVVLWF